MTDDRISGSAKNIGGQVEEGFGRVTGDEKTQLQGKAKQAEGTLQDVYGQAKETAADAAEAIRERASEADDFLRTTIEERRRGHCARHRFLDRPLRPPLRLLGQRAKLTAQFANYALALAHLGDLKLFATSALGSTRTNSANSSLENYSPAEWLPPSEFPNRPRLSGRAARLGERRILKPNALGTKLPQLEILWPMSFLPMSSDRIIVEAIKVGQNLLSQNLPPAHSLTDAATVMRFRELVRSQAIRSALERSSDTFPAFVLREVGHVVADQSKTNRQVISRLWGVFDDPHLNQALGIPDNRGKTVGPPKRY